MLKEVCNLAGGNDVKAEVLELNEHLNSVQESRTNP